MKTAILVSSKTIGQGDEQLGQILMKNFLMTLTEGETAPDYLLLVNGGVFLVAEDSPVREALEILREKGAQIMACGTCVDYFQLREKVKVGTVTNMYTIRDLLLQCEKVITL